MAYNISLILSKLISSGIILELDFTNCRFSQEEFDNLIEVFKSYNEPHLNPIRKLKFDYCVLVGDDKVIEILNVLHNRTNLELVDLK